MKNLSIRKKLILASVFATMLAGFGGVMGLVMMNTMNQQYSAAFVNYGFSQGEVGLFNTEFNNNHAVLRDIIIQQDHTGMQKSKEQLDQSSANLNRYFKSMESGMVNDTEKKDYSTIQKDLKEYESSRDRVAQLAMDNKKSQAYTMMTQDCIPISDKVRSTINALVNEKTRTGYQLSADLGSKGKKADWIVLSSLVFSFMLSVFVTIWITNGINSSVSELLHASSRLAEGDLSIRMHVKAKDELGQLAVTFGKTIAVLSGYIADIKARLANVEKGDLRSSGNLAYHGDFVALSDSVEAIITFINDTIAGMREASRQVASGSEQVSSGAQALSQGAAEQAASVEELSASIIDIAGQLKENAEHAAKVSTNVSDVSTEVEKCNQRMQRMVQAISQIHDSSERIGAIIKTIENIAFQTNILALNAAVEAARAGNEGKGFAVVADEVRSLAGKSAAAAKDTAALIENSHREVQNGTEIANETADSLLHIVASAKAASEMVTRISEATEKQSDKIQQIREGVEQISNVVQMNSATAEESAAASVELAGQAKTMEKLAERFQFRAE